MLLQLHDLLGDDAQPDIILRAVFTFKFNLDPDDHSIPITSSAIDFVGAIFFIAVVVLIGGL